MFLATAAVIVLRERWLGPHQTSYPKCHESLILVLGLDSSSNTLEELRFLLHSAPFHPRCYYWHICLLLHILRAFMISAEALKCMWRALFFSLFSQEHFSALMQFYLVLKRNASVSNFLSWKVWKCLTPLVFTCSFRKSVDLWKMNSLNTVKESHITLRGEIFFLLLFLLILS